MDSLEKFIIDNRDGMDSAVPDLKVWAEIDKQMSAADAPPLHVAKVRPLRQRLRAAAAVAILLIAGGIGGSFLANKSANTDINSLADISQNFSFISRWKKKWLNWSLMSKPMS